MMALLGGSPALLKGLNRSSSLVPCSRRNFAVRAETKSPSWKLEKPNRLWELDTTWYGTCSRLATSHSARGSSRHEPFPWPMPEEDSMLFRMD